MLQRVGPVAESMAFSYTHFLPQWSEGNAFKIGFEVFSIDKILYTFYGL
jgi:hypothetical protein